MATVILDLALSRICWRVSARGWTEPSWENSRNFNTRCLLVNFCCGADAGGAKLIVGTSLSTSWSISPLGIDNWGDESDGEDWERN